ncbi:hypothetical protein CHS0354_018464 [Potamilus streckersoni]|uniref:ABC transmembrane type-1 domain-containing protein n=1 Tax=Potamilus streckersoni TaxID=2493646 RepID=A0AAE0WB18_9BIVA|nr:hypothetical protein CHS0354_018464 [Potamilus streckersoni]
MKKAMLVAATAGVLLLGACQKKESAPASPKNVYAPEVVNTFIEACKPQGGEEVCKCLINNIQNELTQEQFAQGEAQMMGGQPSPEFSAAMKKAVGECKNIHPALDSPASLTRFGNVPPAVIAAMSGLLALLLSPLLLYISPESIQLTLGDLYYRRVIIFTLLQAASGAFLSTLLGGLSAIIIWRLQSPYLRRIAEFSGLCFTLPSVTAVMFILNIYGNSGLFSLIITDPGSDGTGIYGLTGMMLVYLSLNIPYALSVIYTHLMQIPGEYILTADALSLTRWAFWRHVILPALLPGAFRSFFIIFCVCFTAFPVVMMIGGGPEYSIMETEIFRLLRYEYDLPAAAVLAVSQTLLLAIPGLLMLSAVFSPAQGIRYRTVFLTAPAFPVKVWMTAGLLPLLLLCLFPLGFGILSFTVADVFSVIRESTLQTALFHTLLTSLPAAVLGVILAVMYLLLLRTRFSAEYGLSAVFLFVSPVVLGTVTVMVSGGIGDTFAGGYIPTLILHILTAFPFTVSLLKSPLFTADQRGRKLCASLNLTGLRRFMYIDLPVIRTPLCRTFSVAFCLSAGDFSAAALFGGDAYTPLTLLIYRLRGSYRQTEADATGFWLLCLFVLAFALPYLLLKTNRRAVARRQP